MKKRIFYFVSLYMMSNIIFCMDHDNQTTNNLEQRQEQEKQEQQKRQANEYEEMQERQSLERRQILLKHNVHLDRPRSQSEDDALQHDIQRHSKQVSNETDSLEKQHEYEQQKLQEQHEKQKAQAKKTTSLFSRSLNNALQDSTDSSTDTKLKHVTPGETWTASNLIWSRFGKGYREDALQKVTTSKERFAQDKEFLKKTLENLTDTQREEALNTWVSSWQTDFEKSSDPKITLENFYLDIQLMKNTLESVLPDDQVIEIISAQGKTVNLQKEASLLSDETISNTTIQNLAPERIQFKLSTAAPEAKLPYEPIASDAVVDAKQFLHTDSSSSTLAQRKLFADSQSDLIYQLSRMRTPEREASLNNWVSSWNETFEQSSNKSQAEQQVMAKSFATQMTSLAEHISSALPKGQRIEISDASGKKISIQKIMNMYQEHTSVQQLLEQLKPDNFSFKIITDNPTEYNKPKTATSKKLTTDPTNNVISKTTQRFAAPEKGGIYAKWYDVQRSDFPTDKRDLTLSLDKKSTTAKENILNAWKNSWEASFSLSKTDADKIITTNKESKIQKLQTTTSDFVSGTQALLKNVNDLLAKDETLTLIDTTTDQPVDITSLYDSYKAKIASDPSSTIKAAEALNPKNFTFKIKSS